jgi:predicted RNase H-like HicB family nuclease
MTFHLHVDRETDGRWIASVEDLPGVHAYGVSRDDAIAHAMALAFTRLADEVEHGERDAQTLMTVSFTDTAAA